MKGFIWASLLVVIVSASIFEEHEDKFQAFKTQHGKTYKNQVEETKRFAIFRDNLLSIEQHNALYEQGVVSYKKGVNQFTDMTLEEFKAMLTLHQKPSFNDTIKYVKKVLKVPASVDWRTEGQVTGVKDQGSCGSCWAFSVSGSTEAAYFRKTGKLVRLSEQQLVDCATEVNYGCNGGHLDQTFFYIKDNGIQSEESYAYTGMDDSCKYDASQVVTKVNSYVALPDDESALLEAVAHIGPISVAMDASYLSSYVSGIYAEALCSPFYLNHGVLVVGYGIENGQDYWIIKNSWGASWGDQGYFKLLRGTNECGVAEDDVYPVIK